MKNDFFKKNSIIYDPLTNTISRNSFYDYMNYLINNNIKFAFFFFDFDDFKSINDVLGHNVGDEALVLSSNRIKEIINKYGGHVGRYGGDEFLGIVEDLDDYDSVWNIAREINERIREDNNIENLSYALPAGRMTITTGIARFPRDGKTLDEIFNITDKALYRGKQKGKNCFIIYNKELHSNIHTESDARHLDTKNIIEYVFSALTDKSYSLNENLKHVCSFTANYFDVGIFSKNYKGKFEILFSNGSIPNAAYIDENKILDLKINDAEQMIFMYINKLDKKHDKIKKLFEAQSIHASLLIPCSTKQKTYGYLRIDSKYERIWGKEEKIVFQVIANLYAVLLEFSNEEF